VVVDCAAQVLGVPVEKVRSEAKLTLVGGSSVKARLDVDWDDDEQQADALQRLLSRGPASARKASSNSSWRCRRRKAKRRPVRFKRLQIISSRRVSSTGKDQRLSGEGCEGIRSIDHPSADRSMGLSK
jgi:hypothetical protein